MEQLGLDARDGLPAARWSSHRVQVPRIRPLGKTATLTKHIHGDFRDAEPANPGAISLSATAPLNRATGDEEDSEEDSEGEEGGDKDEDGRNSGEKEDD